MSESLTLRGDPVAQSAGTAQRSAPTVYFIDDSATMREVIKIAFRRENIRVITCPNAVTALAQFVETPPDAVITDVIMPDKDGYEVCSHIKQDPRFCKTPVILMSGVVNKTVAEKAIGVHADELIRKPFQPQELIARVKSLLQPKASPAASGAALPATAHPLSNVFAPPQQSAGQTLPPPAAPAGSPWPRALAEALTSRPAVPSPANAAPTASPAPGASAVAAGRTNGGSSSEIQRLRNEILRLELLVKKLQTELAIEKQYCVALELHIKTLQESS